MIKNYFKIAFRSFWKHKIFTAINIVGLSIGISAAIVIFLIVQFDFTFDKFHKDGDRIYRVVTDFVFSGEPYYNDGVTGPLANAVKNEVTGITETAPFLTASYDVAINNGKKSISKFKNEQNIIYAGQSYFNIFKYKWLAGSPRSSLNHPYQVVLSAALVKKYFPALNYDQVIGKQVIYDDSIKTIVSGIIEDFRQNTDLDFHSFISFATIDALSGVKDQLGTRWDNTNGSSQLFVKLAPGASPKRIEAQLAGLLKKYNPPKPENKGNSQLFRLQQLSDVHFNSKYGVYSNNAPASTTTLFGLAVIAVFLLLLGCINFINLTTAQSSQRAKEIGIRKTMGSTRAQLVIQFLSETFLVTLIAVIIAVCIAPVILGLFSGFISPNISANLLHQPGLILFLISLTIVVTGLSGFYPAKVLSGYKPVLVLKNQTSAGSGKTRSVWLRKSLTVSQFVIAQFFMMATILVSKQIYYATHKNLGFKKDAIVYFYTPWKDTSVSHRKVLYNQIKALPGIQMISQGGDIPSSNGWNSNDAIYRDGKKEVRSELYKKFGDENYIKVYHINLLAGRNISIRDTAGGMLINSTYMHVLGFTNPQKVIGKMVSFGGPYNHTIVGVVADFHQGSLHAPIKCVAIMPDVKYNSSTFHIALKPETPGGHEWKTTMAGMQKAWSQMYPNDDFDCKFFDATIAQFYTTEQHTATLLSWATGLSIFISCLGLMGLAIYTTNQRTKEIGVRKVLGASVTQIVTLLSTEMVWLIGLAFLIVTPIAWWAMNKWMQTFADRTTISWWIFVLSGAGMLLTAIFTSSFQTIKAAITNPVKSLRSE